MTYVFLPYQCSTAKQDHEDDEALEPVVLNDPETGLPELPPNLPPAHLRIDLTALKPFNAA